MRAAETGAAEAPGRRFRPGLWPSVAAAAAFVLLASLGTWQAQRLAWKQDLIARAEAGLAAPPAPVPSDPASDLAALDYRRVLTRGRYLHDQAFGFGFSARGGEPGGRLVTPLLLEDGRALLVDRGWLPRALLPPNLPAGLAPEGEVEVAGVARHRAGETRPMFRPDDDPAARRWYGWDFPALAEAVGRPLLPLVLVAQPEGVAEPGALPLVEPVAVDFPNNHLGYAITWYGLAAALVAVYVAFSLRKPDGPSP